MFGRRSPVMLALVALALVVASVAATPAAARPATQANLLTFLGQATLPTGLDFQGTQVGGLSGISYDEAAGVYYSISDDRSQFNPARYYSLTINLSDGQLSNGDVQFQAVTTLRDASGQPFAALSLDPEGIALTAANTLLITSEGDANRGISPFVNQFSRDGQQLSALPVPTKYLPNPPTSGIRNNLAFESATAARGFFFTATENALAQDGPAASPTSGSPARILRYNLRSGQPDKEYLYQTEPVAAAPVPAGSFSTNGLVELLALTNDTMLALERSFSTGVGNDVKLYLVSLKGADDISGITSLSALPPGSIKAAQKTLLFDFTSLGLTLDNLEGMTFGPTLADGRRTLVVVSDNNFSATQFTQFLAFALPAGL